MQILVLYSLTIFLIMFIILEVIPLARKGTWHQLVVPVIFFILVMLYGIDYAYMTKILPNPNKTLYYFKPISDNLERILQVST